ncbi:unnamed protein product [Leptidea sinapis]|uniref:Uncharacterized protein n=1 Tax=Leptidea sinapis TaxID=189913 RepID=A0A5E4R504_9NEOP|nr:unnamed protein product [Leptidea sinapis]
MFPERSIPLLSSTAEEIGIVREKLLEGNQLEQYSTARIIILVIINHQNSLAHLAISFSIPETIQH